MAEPQLHLSQRWRRHGSTCVRGQAFVEGGFLGPDELARHFDGIPVSGLREALRHVNGAFALVRRSGHQLVAAVDRVRSIPLFYSHVEDRCMVSDSAHWLRERTGDTAMDEEARNEFLLTGYVLGDRTLSPSVRQIQAGEMLVSDGGRTETSSYYLHLHGNYLHAAKQTYFEALDGISARVFERLITSCRERPIAVPLSGGYDSRYIVAMLKHLRHAEVVCFAYGRPDSFEVNLSRKVADALGYPWYFAEYDEGKFRALCRSERFREYLVFAGEFTSLPHIQEVLAVHELAQRSVVPSGSVFVPGLCGDLLGGSYVPDELTLRRASDLEREGMVDYVLRKHFSLGPMPPRGVRNRIKRAIAATLQRYPEPTGIEDFVSVNEAWFISHKVAKFVVNELRAYEFFGFDWRLPLWDNELVEFWYRVPLRHRIGKTLYDSYLMERVFAPLHIDLRQQPEWLRSRAVVALRKLLPLWLDALVKKALSILSRVRRTDINAFDGLVNACLEDPALRARPPGGRHVNRVLAELYLARIDEWAKADAPPDQSAW